MALHLLQPAVSQHRSQRARMLAHLAARKLSLSSTQRSRGGHPTRLSERSGGFLMALVSPTA